MNDRASHDQSSPTSPRRASSIVMLLRGLWRPVLVVAIIALIAWIIQPAKVIHEIGEFREWLDETGPWSMVLFLALYILAAIAIVPAALLKVAAGGMFGSVLGLIIASIGSTLGATACFLIARYVARGSLMQRLKQGRRFQKLDALTERHGPIVVALVRLVPVLPGNLVNYAFGLTRVRLSVFVFWSWLCMLPGTVVLVVGTDAFVQGLERDRVPWGLLSIVAAALAMMIVAMIFAHRRFKSSQGRDGDAMEYADI